MIGSDVWIGTNAVIGTGIQIGHGAVVGANSFVNRPIPPYAICAGSPARVLGYRFEEATIARLLSSAWWLRPMSVIESLPFDNVELCLEKLGA